MSRPLIYYFISVFIGCLSSLMLYENALIGAVIAASFFAIFFCTLNKRFLILNMFFFMIGMFSFMLYFNVKVPNSIEFRVIQNKGYYCLGNYKGRKIVASGKINATKEGEVLKVHGKFENSKDYARGIIGTYKIDKYEICDKDIVYYLYETKRNIHAKFKQKLGEDKAALIMALCYGDAGYLSKSQKSEFQKMGVFHAISVSGFHMAIIYKVLEFAIGLKFAILISFIYIFFTGIQASTVRAFIMIIIFKVSKIFFKNYDSLSALGLAGLILLIDKPYYIMDIGFMLSFLATLGILLYYKKILRSLYKLPKSLNESLSITLSSQIFSVPYTAFNIQNFSSGFIFGNIFLLPMYSLIVILGNLALLACCIPIIFDFLVGLLNLILTAVEGANYLILGFCPPISSLTYLDGFAFITIYLSFLLYKYKNEKFKYLPLFVLVFMLLQTYSFVPQVYHINFSKGEGIIVKDGVNKVMICNYDQSVAKEVINLKEMMNIEKIITNPKEKIWTDVSGNLHLKTVPYEEGFFSIIINNEKKEFVFISNGMKEHAISTFTHQNLIKFPGRKVENSSSNNKSYNIDEDTALYVIIFNRIIRLY